MPKPLHPAILASSGPLLTGLVAAYAFTDGSGTNLNDSTANNNDGTLVNTPTWATGPLGTELDFNASSSQYVNVGNPTALQITGSMSVAFSYRIDTLMGNGADYKLVTKQATGQQSFILDVTRTDADVPGSGVRFYINGGPGGLVAEGRLPVAGDDRIVVGVYDAAAQTIKIYIDGTLANTTTGTAASINNTTANVNFARREETGAEEYHDGQIRFVYFWNTALDATKAASISSDPWQIFVSPPIGLFDPLLRPEAWFDTSVV